MSLQRVKALITNNEWSVVYNGCQQAVNTQMENSNCFCCCPTRNCVIDAVPGVFPVPFSLHQSSDYVESSGRVAQNAG